MPVGLTRYSVPGWGDGELWTRGRVVLAHEFAFLAGAGNDGERGALHTHPALPRRAPASSARPPKGPHGPPTGTLAANSVRVGGGFVPSLQQVAAGEPGLLDPAELAKRFAAFLAGEDVRFDDVELDLDDSTPFQYGVATALRAVLRGEVVSYGELAALAGYPGAARAVGTFCARNRFMLLLPCHRVVGAAGPGGYGSAGIGVKRRLLSLEGIVL